MKLPLKAMTAALLAASMAFALPACGSDAGSGSQTAAETASNAPADAASAETEAAETEIRDALPDLDFGGATLPVFCTDYEVTMAFQNMYTAEENGDVVNDALYRRNTTVEERLNIKTEWEEFDFSFSDREQMYNRVRAIVMSGDGSADVIFVPTYFISSMVMEGLFTDLAALPYIDLDRPWWFSDFTANATIDGKTFMAAGDAVLPYITGIFCLAFNRDMAENYGLGNLYDVVNGGAWTIDKMTAMIADLYQDLNGDGAADVGDQYGFELLEGNFISPFEDSTSALCVTKKPDGSYEYTFGNDRNVGVYDKVYSIIHDTGATYFKHALPRAESPFVAGRSLFTGITFNDTVYFRDLAFNYSVIPYPKWDEAQDAYHCRTSTGTVVVTVPVTAADSDAVGAFLEAMSSEGYKTLTPAYFEVALKIKYATDTETADMLELIKSSASMDIGIMFASALGGPTDKFKSTVQDKTKSGMWASTAASIQDATESKLADFIAAVEAIG